jgi:broad specificity phosphatase PhoE
MANEREEWRCEDVLDAGPPDAGAPMTVLLLRHAQAGSRSDWRGLDDRDRPLTREGRRQSADLVDLLGEISITEIRTSPYRRCMESVAPIAARLGLPVIIDDALAEGPSDDAVKLVRSSVPETVLLCSHGDVIPGVLSTLMVEDGLDLGPGPRCQKGSVWFLEPRPGSATFVAATYAPPPSRSW